MIIRLSVVFIAVTAASIFCFRAATANDFAAANDPKVDVDMANTLLAQGKYTDAIALYDNAIRTLGSFQV